MNTIDGQQRTHAVVPFTEFDVHSMHVRAFSCPSLAETTFFITFAWKLLVMLTHLLSFEAASFAPCLGN